MVGRYIGDMLMLCVFGPSSGKMKNERYHHNNICIPSIRSNRERRRNLNL